MSRYEQIRKLGPGGERPRYDEASQTLIAGTCRTCGTRSWPQRSVCRRCHGTEIEAEALPETGEIIAATRVWVPVEGIEPPYVLALVSIGGVQLAAHLRCPADDLPPTSGPARLRVSEAGSPPFWFEPVGPDTQT
jgi:uncharacterized OB-fold protein